MYLMRLLKLACVSIIVGAIGVGVSIPAQALSYATKPQSNGHVFGSELSVVRFQQGEFRNSGNGQWEEVSYKTKQAVYRFVAQSVKTDHVVLFDASRNVTLVLDINLGQILYAVGTPTFRPIYNITTFQYTRRLPAGQHSTPKQPVVPSTPSNPQVYTPGGNTGVNVGGNTPAPQVDRRQWQHFSSRSQGRRVHRLDYGIPETDAITFRARCVRRSGAPRFIIAANVRNQRNGSVVNINFNANGFNRSYRGEVVGAGNTQERIAGIRVTPSANDQIWSMLARKNSISYSVLGERRTLSLSGSSGAVNAFLNGCRPRQVVQNPLPPQTPGNNPVPPTTNSAGGEISCNRFGRIASRNANRRTNVTFVNRAGGQRVVMWIDYQGQPKEYGVIPAGGSRTFSTYVSHPWMIVNGPGDCSQLFMPRARNSTFVVNR